MGGILQMLAEGVFLSRMPPGHFLGFFDGGDYNDFLILYINLIKLDAV